ncbi:putative glycosyltransferase [Caenibius tardaugens NBRC 16725]|uniref:Putative glycosyltransferase n=1 Tax=Caenibius tardaugens NBRC 16725 TaxID=1219035 RepID=U2ZZP4_9SPHN|nr:glycosyltransferase [Caenibius tardaugens]AZI36360.1 glycosyltransferase [Caenibius tardaugens NBRC 16725]GAD50839.1 putative glycosyltransferase [Caenibius tardaugens NBRC 16725]
MIAENRPRILHIITGLNDGGAEAVLFRLCKQDSANHHHVVSLMDLGKYGPLLEEVGVPVSALGMLRGRVTVAGLWQLWRLIRKLQPHAIQTWMYHADLIGGLIGRLAGQRNIVWGIRQSILVSGESRQSTIWVARLCALLSRWVPRSIVCCAERSREVHTALGYDSARMHVIFNGYELSMFRPNPIAGLSVREELGIDRATPLIGFVARFDPLKDHANLLQAVALLEAQGSALQCVLVGTGMTSGNSALSRMITELGLSGRVLLVGPRTDIPSVMNALDLHVMSSVSEGFPNVLAEAMACGTPCVSTDVGDAGDIVGPTGLTVTSRSPKALAKAIDELLVERGTLAWTARKSAARRRVAERYAIERMVRSYHEVWNCQESAPCTPEI